MGNLWLARYLIRGFYFGPTVDVVQKYVLGIEYGTSNQVQDKSVGHVRRQKLTPHGTANFRVT